MKLSGIFLVAIKIVYSAVAWAANPDIRVHEIARPGGSFFGQTSAVDVDKDGDLDFISGRQFGDVFWFENLGTGRWVQHLIGEKALTDVGGVAFDVDGDGWVDQVSGGTWYRNPGNPQEAARWERFENGATPTHDILAADIDGDGKLDLVSILDKAGVFWYRIPQDPTKAWIEHKLLGVTTPQCHGGIAVGDIDGDGDLDVSRVDRWLENADGKGETWIEHQTFDFGKEGPWGLQTRAILVDVDHDGDLDLIQAEGDVLDGRVAWFENRNGKGRDWERHLIKLPGHNQDFHSLCVADFDNDGDVDIFSGGGPLTKGEHQWLLWENADGRGGNWNEHLIRRGLQTHESVCGDVDGDGDIDILTKPWNGDLHLFVENQLKTASKVSRRPNGSAGDRAVAAEPPTRTQLGVREAGFTLNGAPVFLLGCSYYGGLGGDAKTWRADLDDMERAGFNWIRVWATWGAFGRDVSAVDADGRPRDPYLEKLTSLVAECDRRGIIVDVTLSRGNGSTGPARLQSQAAHRRAVETLVTALKSRQNWYLDLANERNIRDARFVSIEDLKDLRDRVREMDPARLVTASHGGDLSADDLRKYVIGAALDFVAPHRPRDRDSPGQTEQRTREWLQAMESLGRVVPVHYQEPIRRGYQGYAPEASDYQNDLRGAITGGAAGWCFHNGSTRGADNEQPRRSFDLSDKRLWVQLDAVERDAVSRFHELVPLTAGPLRVRHTRLADLGGEHVAHAIFRHTPGGGSIVSWGERILEWPLDIPILHEAMPRQAGFEYSNGGCALDIDGDGTDEIVVARGRTCSCSDPDLLWFKETGAGKFWTEHQIGNIGKGPIAPHDIQPFSARQPDGSLVRGVVAVIDRRQLVWYQIPDDPTRPWLRHEITELPLASQSGIAVGNLAGNDRSDVACGMFWAECPADPIRDSWKVRRFGHWEDGGWGGMAKLELADMDGDGRLEIVATEAEIPESRLGIFSRDPQHPDAVWKCREIEVGLYCPHSLVLADLDGDSRTDIVIGEMTAGGWSYPLNPKPRILTFLNRGDKPFDRHVLAEGLGVHEMGLVPNRRDGAWVVFAADEIQPQKLPDMKTHVSYWKIEAPTTNRSSPKP